jgi:hypothetical protein
MILGLYRDRNGGQVVRRHVRGKRAEKGPAETAQTAGPHHQQVEAARGGRIEERLTRLRAPDRLQLSRWAAVRVSGSAPEKSTAGQGRVKNARIGSK